MKGTSGPITRRVSGVNGVAALTARSLQAFLMFAGVDCFFSFKYSIIVPVLLRGLPHLRFNEAQDPGFGGVRNFPSGLVDVSPFIGGLSHSIGLLSELKGELAKGASEIELNDNVVVRFSVGL